MLLVALLVALAFAVAGLFLALDWLFAKWVASEEKKGRRP